MQGRVVVCSIVLYYRKLPGVRKSSGMLHGAVLYYRNLPGVGKSSGMLHGAGVKG